MPLPTALASSKRQRRAVAIVMAVVTCLAMLYADAPRTAEAEATGSVAIGCEALRYAIDGDPDDALVGDDFTEACMDGIDEVDVANISDGLGDEDGTLEVSDFHNVDVDDNQIEDGLTLIDCTTTDRCRGTILLFIFLDDDDPVIIDAPTGLNQRFLDPTSGIAGPFQDFVCTTPAFASQSPDDNQVTDLDCDGAVSDDGDGVVVSIIEDGTSDPGDLLTVNADRSRKRSARKSSSRADLTKSASPCGNPRFRRAARIRWNWRSAFRPPTYSIRRN